MATSRSTWKRRERDSAALFGTRRQIGSGSGGRADQTRSDSLHPRIFLETKLRASSAVRTLFDKTAAMAKAESKIPVLALFDKGRPGALLVFSADHLIEIAAELLAARDEAAEAKDADGC